MIPTARNQRIVKRLVDEHVLLDITGLMTELLEQSDGLDEELNGLTEPMYREAARANGWRHPEDDVSDVFGFVLICNETSYSILETSGAVSWDDLLDEQWCDTEAEAREEGWRPFDEVADNLHEFVRLDADGKLSYDCDADTWEYLCRLEGIEPESPDVLGYYAVTEWAGRRLEAKGEIVKHVHGLHIWCRQTAGQAVRIDGVWNEIASDEEILVGQRNRWSHERHLLCGTRAEKVLQRCLQIMDDPDSSPQGKSARASAAMRNVLYVPED